MYADSCSLLPIIYAVCLSLCSFMPVCIQVVIFIITLLLFLLDVVAILLLTHSGTEVSACVCVVSSNQNKYKI